MAERDDGTDSGRWTRAQGERAVAAWQSSGFDRAQYCQQSGVARHKLEYWARVVEARPKRKQLRKPPQVISLLPMVVRASGAVVPSGENTIVRPIALTSAVEPAWAARLVRALFAGQPS